MTIQPNNTLNLYWYGNSNIEYIIYSYKDLYPVSGYNNGHRKGLPIFIQV